MTELNSALEVVCANCEHRWVMHGDRVLGACSEDVPDPNRLGTLNGHRYKTRCRCEGWKADVPRGLTLVSTPPKAARGTVVEAGSTPASSTTATMVIVGTS